VSNQNVGPLVTKFLRLAKQSANMTSEYIFAKPNRESRRALTRMEKRKGSTLFVYGDITKDIK